VVVEEEEVTIIKTNLENKMITPFTEISLMIGKDIKGIMNKKKDLKGKHLNYKKI
jgi:hypothetical protein